MVLLVPRLTNRHIRTGCLGPPTFNDNNISEVAFIPLDPQKLSLEADPSLNGCQSLEFINAHSFPKWGLEFINVQPPQKGVCLQNSLTYSPPKGDLPLEFINIQPSKVRSASRIHQHTAPQKGSASRFYQTKMNSMHQKGGLPLRTISGKLGRKAAERLLTVPSLIGSSNNGTIVQSLPCIKHIKEI